MYIAYGSMVYNSKCIQTVTCLLLPKQCAGRKLPFLTKACALFMTCFASTLAPT